MGSVKFQVQRCKKSIHSTILKFSVAKLKQNKQISRYLLNNAFQLFSIICESSEYSNWGLVEHKQRAKSVKNSVTFARSSAERHANIKIDESQVFSLCDAFVVASRGLFISWVHFQFYINSLQNFGFSEHPRKLPKALTQVITEIDVPIGKLHDRNKWIFTLRVNVHIKTIGLRHHRRSRWTHTIGNPAVIIPKADGDIRLCIDMRRAKEAILRGRYPILTVDEQLHNTNGSKGFTKLI